MTRMENERWEEWILEATRDMAFSIEPVAYRDAGEGAIQQVFRVELDFPGTPTKGGYISVLFDLADVVSVMTPHPWDDMTWDDDADMYPPGVTGDDVEGWTAL